jgi:hypothetical protein
MLKTAFAAALLSLAGTAGAQTVIYDTFNEADQANLFDCCNVLPVTTKHSSAHQRAAVAVPFTPAAKGHITEVDVAVSDLDGTGDRMKVHIMGSSEGLPGQVKHVFLIQPVPPGGQCCAFVALSASGVPVTAGGHYWIELEAVDHLNSGWNLNTAGLSGPYAIEGREGKGWSMTEGPVPAVRVIAK